MLSVSYATCAIDPGSSSFTGGTLVLQAQSSDYDDDISFDKAVCFDSNNVDNDYFPKNIVLADGSSS